MDSCFEDTPISTTTVVVKRELFIVDESKGDSKRSYLINKKRVMTTKTCTTITPTSTSTTTTTTTSKSITKKRLYLSQRIELLDRLNRLGTKSDK
ncbi:hypothetical protein CYY_007007 [Polysphondylium violaceum]|uniref:Uncharacterized protein n=1 Tax=Polysphondylium violaceum TaxID=133409 RepID=A0A8J4PSH7_9MYCE|nr:hypothetical protein CYY_007007 [Polysphondylium violaceum]